MMSEYTGRGLIMMSEQWSQRAKGSPPFSKSRVKEMDSQTGQERCSHSPGDRCVLIEVVMTPRLDAGQGRLMTAPTSSEWWYHLQPGRLEFIVGGAQRLALGVQDGEGHFTDRGILGFFEFAVDVAHRLLQAGGDGGRGIHADRQLLRTFRIHVHLRK